MPRPPDAVQHYEFVDDIVGGSIPREFISACDKGFQEAIKKGSLIGFPVVGVVAEVLSEQQAIALRQSQ